MCPCSKSPVRVWPKWHPITVLVSLPSQPFWICHLAQRMLTDDLWIYASPSPPWIYQCVLYRLSFRSDLSKLTHPHWHNLFCAYTQISVQFDVGSYLLNLNWLYISVTCQVNKEIDQTQENTTVPIRRLTSFI